MADLAPFIVHVIYTGFVCWAFAFVVFMAGVTGVTSIWCLLEEDGPDFYGFTILFPTAMGFGFAAYIIAGQL